MTTWRKPTRLDAKKFGTYRALIIGNGEYEHHDDLPEAPAEALKVAEVLTDEYGFEVYEPLLNATAEDIRTALER